MNFKGRLSRDAEICDFRNMKERVIRKRHMHTYYLLSMIYLEYI